MKGVSLPLVIKDCHSVCVVAFSYSLLLINKLTFTSNSILAYIWILFYLKLRTYLVHGLSPHSGALAPPASKGQLIPTPMFKDLRHKAAQLAQPLYCCRKDKWKCLDQANTVWKPARCDIMERWGGDSLSSLNAFQLQWKQTQPCAGQGKHADILVGGRIKFTGIVLATWFPPGSTTNEHWEPLLTWASAIPLQYMSYNQSPFFFFQLRYIQYIGFLDKMLFAHLTDYSIA